MGEDWRLSGRDGEIRTRDPLNPIQVRYQAALRPDLRKSAILARGQASLKVDPSALACPPRESYIKNGSEVAVAERQALKQRGHPKDLRSAPWAGLA